MVVDRGHSGGAVLVTAIRRTLTVADVVPSAIGFAKAARVDPKPTPSLVIISVVSLVTDASLGPSWSPVGSWVVAYLAIPTVRFFKVEQDAM